MFTWNEPRTVVALFKKNMMTSSYSEIYICIFFFYNMYILFCLNVVEKNCGTD